MNKTLFFYISISLLFLSCQNKTDKTSPENAPEINTISVIIDDQLWNGEVGDSIRKKFASPVLGLPQEEPLFTINQFPVKLFEGYSSNCRNIIIIKKGPKNHFKITENEYVNPQNVIHISGKTVDDIQSILEKNAPSIIKKIRDTEIIHYQDMIKLSLLNPQTINKKFNISLYIPVKYSYAINQDNFLWLKKEIISGNTSVLIYQVPLDKINEENAVNDIVKMRDSIGKIYIHGIGDSTSMVTEEAYAPYFSKMKLAGKKAFETRGTWELKNDFMMGPFINYAIFDESNNRILVLEGFCYAPSKEKRDLMFELEAIIKSIKFLDKK